MYIRRSVKAYQQKIYNDNFDAARINNPNRSEMKSLICSKFQSIDNYLIYATTPPGNRHREVSESVVRKTFTSGKRSGTRSRLPEGICIQFTFVSFYFLLAYPWRMISFNNSIEAARIIMVTFLTVLTIVPVIMMTALSHQRECRIMKLEHIGTHNENVIRCYDETSETR